MLESPQFENRLFCGELGRFEFLIFVKRSSIHSINLSTHHSYELVSHRLINSQRISQLQIFFCGSLDRFWVERDRSNDDIVNIPALVFVFRQELFALQVNESKKILPDILYRNFVKEDLMEKEKDTLRPNHRLNMNLYRIKIPKPAIKTNRSQVFSSSRQQQSTQRTLLKLQEMSRLPRLSNLSNHPHQRQPQISSKMLQGKQNSLKRISQVSSRVVRNSRVLRQSYINKLEEIQKQSRQLGRLSNVLLSKTSLAEKNLKDSYMKLLGDSLTMTTGVQEYHLEQQKRDIYKEEIRDMWMRTDR